MSTNNVEEINTDLAEGYALIAASNRISRVKYVRVMIGVFLGVAAIVAMMVSLGSL